MHDRTRGIAFCYSVLGSTVSTPGKWYKINQQWSTVYMLLHELSNATQPTDSAAAAALSVQQPQVTRIQADSHNLEHPTMLA